MSTKSTDPTPSPERAGSTGALPLITPELRDVTRIVQTVDTSSYLMKGDPALEEAGDLQEEHALPVLLQQGWRIAAVLPAGTIKNNPVYFWLLIPPPSAAK